MMIRNTRCSFLVLLTLLVLLGSAGAIAGTWSNTGTMLNRRVLHTATLLSNGKVLVAGGLSSGRIPTATAELYDPGAGTWTSTGSMATARSRHTATLLSDGRVLVAGGRNASGSTIATGEIYDPQTGVWTTTGSMNIPRSYHAATRLSDGKVLVTGGGHDVFGGSPIEKTAEIYDPETGSWQFADSLSRARYGHTATLLPDGRVLLTGGAGRGGDCVSNLTAEIYDPNSSHFNPARPMSAARGFHAATLLSDGKILVTGGNTIARQVLIPGVPPICTATTETAELFDPDSDAWTPIASMSTSRSGHTSTLLSDGSVLIVGGRSSVLGSVATTEILDPAGGIWISGGNMSAARAYHTATRLADGRILVAGGHSGVTFNRQQLATAEIYTP